MLLALREEGRCQDEAPHMALQQFPISRSIQDKLNLSEDEVNERLEELGTLLPDLKSRLLVTEIPILSGLLQDLPVLAINLMKFKEALPGINLSALISKHPTLLLEWTPGKIKARVEEMKDQLPGLDIILLIEAEPHYLNVDLPAVIADIERLLPALNPIHVLATSPELVLSMNNNGMSSALDVEGYVPRGSTRSKDPTDD